MKLGSAAAAVRSTRSPRARSRSTSRSGVGGIPRGRITEIFGPESSGKTTVCQHVIAEAQRRGGIAAFIDVEHALDPGYARACGVNVDELLVSQPDTGEQALEITETLIRSGGVDIVVLDSVAALVPRAEIEGEMGDSFVGIQARLMSQALRKLTGAVSAARTPSLVFTNQLREKIGVMFGNPETTPGGRALKFYASVRLDIRRVETIKTGTESVGNRVRVKVVKNKVSPPFRVAEFDVMYGEGISREGGLLDVGVAMDVVTKTGAWFTFGETRLGQGREASKDFLKGNADISARDRPPDPGQDHGGRPSRWRASKRPSRSQAAPVPRCRPSRMRGGDEPCDAPGVAGGPARAGGDRVHRRVVRPLDGARRRGASDDTGVDAPPGRGPPRRSRRWSSPARWSCSSSASSTAWAEGLPLLGPFVGAGANWLFVSLLLFLSVLPLVPLVFLPRGRVFEAALEEAEAAGVVTDRAARRRGRTRSSGRRTSTS